MDEDEQVLELPHREALSLIGPNFGGIPVAGAAEAVDPGGELPVEKPSGS